MQTTTIDSARVGLLDYTTPKINRRSARAQVRRIRRDMHRAKVRYADGTAAERQSLDTLLGAQRRAATQAMLSAQGRRIDLLGLLRQQRADGMPAWALVNPDHEIGAGGAYGRENGCYMPAVSSGYYGATAAGYAIARRQRGTGTYTYCDVIACDLGLPAKVTPSGMPALPAKVRRIIADPKVRRRANWIGVLYQPAEWTVARPDPAVVVEWTDLPGQYFALAIWGGDYARIMEWVS